jgi:hypothetical protein
MIFMIFAVHGHGTSPWAFLPAKTDTEYQGPVTPDKGSQHPQICLFFHQPKNSLVTLILINNNAQSATRTDDVASPPARDCAHCQVVRRLFIST